MPDNFIDLTVTSPPYDDLRDYEGYDFDFEKIALELYRVTKPGGVVVWIVNDQTKNGSESLTSAKQKIFFRERCGFDIHDTMIWEKTNFANPSHNRYHQIFEYMFVLSKGRPATFNPIKDIKTIWRKPFGKNTYRDKNGKMKERKAKDYGEYRMRGNVWLINTSGQENPCQEISHPATFSLSLARDHISSWSNKGDLVYDPMMGSGTTAIAALQLKRNFIGSEISKKYCDGANKAIEPYLWQHQNQLDLAI